MGAGLIYAIIIAMWAVVLVPMWMRRHDERRQSRSVDRFSDAMRTLARRSSPSVGAREVVVPRRQTAPVVYTTGNAPVTEAAPRRTTSLAQRRRRTSMSLLGSVLVVAGLAVLGVVPAWLVAVPVVLVAAFAVHLRQEANRAAQRQARLRRQEKELAARRARDEVGLRAGVVTAAARGRVAAEAPLLRTAPAAAPAAPVPAAAVAQPADELYDAVAEQVWEPVPVPLPTYVTAPKAPRSVRTIDLTQSGSWTSGRLDEAETAEAAAEAAAVEVDVTAAEESRRAVNG